MSTTTPTSTRQWVLARRPTGAPILSGPSATFSLVTAELPPLAAGQVLCRVRYISNDPGQRGFIGIGVADDRMYVPPVHVGAAMRAGVIAEVVASLAPSIAVGQLVMTLHLGQWAELVVLDAADCQPLAPPPGMAVTHFLGALGAPGLTAYYGVVEVLKARPQHTLVVSGAAGATGGMVVQIAKRLVGCARVVGIAGGADKCAWVRDALGADACVDYKSASFLADLARATDGYVDLYFDNVGGDVLDAMLPRMQKGGTVAVCGAISTYNDAGPMKLKNWMEVVSMRLNFKGFILLDYAEQIPSAIGELVKAVQEGKVVLGDEHETLVETGIEGVPETWMKLFEGVNRGKLITKLV
ncbi:nadp-dependent leukotriene b4 12-hydroxydehydrogenase protein [Diplodia corticola]|uniref:Nadp-dependent leukotriene b4 12-hydroxydehydrogenase protein n=1 Tax=Diplodia corticola TaxID=236234 RepID=A0A1J9R9J2_9PEZI|nr:nadp-dependent leukotriene b4 12-hydroxydehydrogenase protein [Diplodia corticola]OJD29099.1 nadp-dependent leukotriene b4 12-hydroxydehydrogenase protein [Diplodia corticola]